MSGGTRWEYRRSVVHLALLMVWTEVLCGRSVMGVSVAAGKRFVIGSRTFEGDGEARPK
jgi:hypothetical protein